MSTSAEVHFIEVAKRFCGFVEAPPAEDALQMLLPALLELYTAALTLHVEPAGWDHFDPDMTTDQTASPRWVEIIGARDFYYEVYDPRAEDAPVCASLLADVQEIHQDLREALAQPAPAIACAARFAFETHWGVHCTDALRAMHWVLLR